MNSKHYLYGAVTLFGHAFQRVRLVLRVLKGRSTCSLPRGSEFGSRYAGFNRLY